MYKENQHQSLMKTRLWCFTNYNLEFDYEKYLAETTAEYVAYGLETCPSTKREHHQGWVYFSAQRGSKKNVAKQLGNCHVEPCRGNIDQQDDYCSKEGELVTFGKRPKPGTRTDLEAVAKRINSGTRVDELCVEFPELVHQYGRTLDRLEDIALRSISRSWMTEGLWIYGPTGVGKSHKAFDGFDPKTHYVHNFRDGGWWDGYTGQEVVIFNEFRGQVEFSELLDLCDKWPKTVKRRGRAPVPFLAKKVIITSCKHPREIYKNVLDEEDSLSQLMRRFIIEQIPMTFHGKR